MPPRSPTGVPGGRPRWPRFDLPLQWKAEDFETLRGLVQVRDTQGLFKGFCKVLGLLVTAIALTMGAEFWYNLLKNFLLARQRDMSKAENASGSA